jgi:hypothetical protein
VWDLHPSLLEFYVPIQGDCGRRPWWWGQSGKKKKSKLEGSFGESKLSQGQIVASWPSKGGIESRGGEGERSAALDAGASGARVSGCGQRMCSAARRIKSVGASRKTSLHGSRVQNVRRRPRGQVSKAPGSPFPPGPSSHRTWDWRFAVRILAGTQT